MTPPRHPGLFQPWLAGDPAPAYLLAGEGSGLADLLGELLQARFRDEGAAVELRLLTAADLERESASIEWRTPSFFASRRVFVLPDLEEIRKNARKDLLAYLRAPEPAVTLVLPCTDRDGLKTFSAVPGVRSASPREDQVVSVLARYVTALAAEAGKALADDAAEFFARWVGTDFSRVRAETRKLLSFAGDRKEIGEDDIRAVCVARGEVSPFRLADALFLRDAPGCLSLFRKFARGADASDYHGLVGAIAWDARKRMGASGYVPRGRPALSEERGGAILTALSRIDRGLKGESGLSPEQLFEIQLLMLLA